MFIKKAAHIKYATPQRNVKKSQFVGEIGLEPIDFSLTVKCFNH